MGARAGLDCLLLLNTDSYEDPDWEIVENVRNPGVTKGKTMAEVTTRRHKGFKAFLGTLKEFGLEFEMNTDDTDEHYTAFEESYWANSLVDIAVVRPTGTEGEYQGVRMQMEVEQFDESQDQEGQVVTTVKLVVRDPDDAETPVVEEFEIEFEAETEGGGGGGGGGG
jgi:hypothetical protein